MIIALILSVAEVKAEFNSYSLFSVGQYNNGTTDMTRLSHVTVLRVDDTYDEALHISMSNPGGLVNAMVIYQIGDMNLSQYKNIAYVDVNCTYLDSMYDTNGNFISQTVTNVISQRYTTANDNTQTFEYPFSLDKGDQAQCILQNYYKSITNNTIAFPFTTQWITPTYNTNFVAKLENYIGKLGSQLAVDQATHQATVLQTYNDQIAGYVAYIVKGIYELYLVAFFLIKIALIYIAFILVILAIVFPVFLLIRFRKKVREWLNLEKTY